MRKINKPIKFFGLSSGQFAIFMLLTAIIIIVSIFKQLHPILIIGIISAILFLSGLLFQTLKKEHKAGNPDYLHFLFQGVVSDRDCGKGFFTLLTFSCDF